ncbi:MAG: hypothetical protein CMJ75_06780 [Planctomycetaceae bacterium]|nr:hypothetical protein [Planctomycetaceae bacterium]
MSRFWFVATPLRHTDRRFDPARTGDHQVIKQAGPGLESFAFHPNGKLAVATCLAQHKNSIAVLDIASKAARLLYHLDASGSGQGIEFTPEENKLFVGSAAANRSEVYDVVGEYELRTNHKFLKNRRSHCSLTIGPRYLPKQNVTRSAWQPGQEFPIIWLGATKMEVRFFCNRICTNMLIPAVRRTAVIFQHGVDQRTRGPGHPRVYMLRVPTRVNSLRWAPDRLWWLAMPTAGARAETPIAFTTDCADVTASAAGDRSDRSGNSVEAYRWIRG